MKFVSSQEVIEFHDRLISRDGGQNPVALTRSFIVF